ncbi:peptide/nickel transport system permease protein [Sediminihabitans luteus]|uniref:Peptide/nickel transport system permease protein n=1 Tax=Sediminihabitans luteus TaxID=1138585 RepID=A0A2M9CZZ7_9CELL|nr:ABC transporter permease [Sediminihabitans luteus]PJJ77521.1 peptide/nickel transport system permease protein [Sediminihabitans luteus]GII98420.1 peptide ABC transporter permease [Sediminihabitans luteus]
MSSMPVGVVDAESEILAPVEPTRTPGARAKRSRVAFLSSGKATAGLVILVLFAVFAIIGPWVAPYDPNEVTVDLLLPPSGAHWLGTDHLGRDVLSQLLVGTRSVLLVGVLAGVFATLLAILVGVSAGFLGGVGDEILSALSNVFLVIPALPLIIIVASQAPDAGNLLVAIVLAATGWAWGARVLRAQTLSLRKRDFIEAARANGESTARIVWFETLPNLTAIIASSFVSTVTFAVLSQTTLAFIGVTSSSDWSWGTVLYWAQANQALSRGAWWWFIPAGLLIATLGMALTLVNFGIDEFVNPRLRAAGLSGRGLRKQKITPRIGFTAVRLDPVGARAPGAPTAQGSTASSKPPGTGSTPTHQGSNPTDTEAAR